MDHATRLYPVPAEFAARARIDAKRYKADYARSVSDPQGFWGEVGRRLDWIRPYTKVKDVSFRAEDFHIRWYEDGTLNAAHNCLDRHLAERADRVAIIWEGDRLGESRKITYRELHDDVCRFANVLRGLGVRKGDRVTIYLPMIPEAAVAMLACARIGAIHSVIFAVFSLAGFGAGVGHQRHAGVLGGARGSDRTRARRGRLCRGHDRPLRAQRIPPPL